LETMREPPLTATNCSLCARPGYEVRQDDDLVPRCEWSPVASRSDAYAWGRRLAHALFPAEVPRPKPAYRGPRGRESPYEKLKRENRVEDVAARMTTLRTRGRLEVGLCPFHTERTPSFTVYPESQRFICYGCQRAGDVIDLLKHTGEL